MGSFSSVRSLERGLKILEALNRCHGTKAQQLARMVELPRPTVYRLLETMENLGYITRSKSDDSWNLTAQVKSLSSGFHDDVWVTRVAAPILHSLGRELLWPLDLVTFENDAMIVREIDARRESVLDRPRHGRCSFADPANIGRPRLSGVQRAGRTRSDSGEAPANRKAGRRAGARQAVRRMPSHRNQQKGYGFRTDGFNPHTASISVPILVNDRVLASITVIWIASALSFADAVERNLPPLKRAIGQIEEQLRNLSAVPA